MSKAPAGAVVGITYDSAANIRPGQWLVTKTGRSYLILEAREVGDHDRWKLLARVSATPPPQGATVLDLRWHPRGTKKVRALRPR